MGLLWNVRRVGTPWQVKNIPPAPKKQSRTGFVLRRVAVTLFAYLFVDVVVSMPPSEEVMVRADKAGLLAPCFRCGAEALVILSFGAPRLPDIGSPLVFSTSS